MREGVIANYVPGVRDFPRDIGPLAHVATNHEERRMDLMLREHFEQFQRVRIIRAVIVGERKLLRSTCKAGKCPAIPLASRGHGLVASGCSDANRGKSSDESGKHEEIVEELRASSYELRAN